jgi:AraC-like DNA-binding protein
MANPESSCGPALRMVHRYETSTVGLVAESCSLRRQEFALRRTCYRRIVVDERMLSDSFPLLQPPSRLQVFVLLEGKLRLEHDGLVWDVAPGEAWLVGTSMQTGARFEDATFLDLEWTSPHAPSIVRPTRLKSPHPDEARRVARALERVPPSQLALLDDTFELLRGAGAPIELTAQVLLGGPSERDRRIARAMEEQLSSLRTKASALHLGDDAKLSPRQLQRLVHEFNLRYGMNAGNWRDTRNRWRVQIAAVLLSRRELTVRAIAEEVGYGNAASLARAFAIAGFPAPIELRERLLSGQH